MSAAYVIDFHIINVCSYMNSYMYQSRENCSDQLYFTQHIFCLINFLYLYFMTL